MKSSNVKCSTLILFRSLSACKTETKDASGFGKIYKTVAFIDTAVVVSYYYSFNICIIICILYKYCSIDFWAFFHIIILSCYVDNTLYKHYTYLRHTMTRSRLKMKRIWLFHKIVLWLIHQMFAVWLCVYGHN